MSADRREFRNPFDDFDISLKDCPLVKDGTSWRLAPAFKTHLESWIQDLLGRLEADMERDADWDDSSVYTGTAGLILLFMHLNSVTSDTKYLQRAAELEQRLPSLRPSHRRPTLLCGDAGVVAVTAAVHQAERRTEEARRRLATVMKLAFAVEESSSLPDELLYGRAGYLATLLYIRRTFGNDVPNLEEAMQKTVSAIVSSGARLAARERSPCPLMYAWHDKHYLGAAHGLCGILSLLLQVPQLVAPPALAELVRPTVDYLAGLRLPSGNYPSSLESRTSDRLVHWCHGAPGFCHMFCLAYQTFGDERYLQLARQSADLVWARGLLRKGYGLCHGTAGNAYTFLHLHQLTQDPRDLYRACRFAEWCSEYGRHGCRTPDRPVSLFEGIAGTVYFLADLLHPEKARFPGLH
ncbi:lanC-like protein 2 [Pollicipes pollicipes]|uniref:lanC-like protein 2 n=1 Tax=Pollicipes pollicipes TaxID=41117 RepID=UPI0018856FE2|nr:lanC-like protein 2 [Pollicipes pollicipes]